MKFISYRTGDAFHLDLDPGSVDLLVCRHLSQAVPDFPRVLAEFVRHGPLTAFEARTERRSAIYSYEDTGKTAALSRAREAHFESQRVAWKYFQTRRAAPIVSKAE